MNYLNVLKKFLKGGLRGWCKIVSFMDWFCHNLIVLIKKCKIPYKNLNKALLLWRNQVLCLKIWKLWRAPTTLQFNIFCRNSAHVFYLPKCTKKCGIFFISFRFWVICKNLKKDLVSIHSFFTLLLITQDLNKIKKIPHTLL